MGLSSSRRRLCFTEFPGEDSGGQASVSSQHVGVLDENECKNLDKESAEYPREQSTPPLHLDADKPMLEQKLSEHTRYLDELDNDCNQEYDWRYDAADEESGR